MSFLKRLFGIGTGSVGDGEAADQAPGREVDHKGFAIRASPRRVGGQFQVAGIIRRDVGGELREHVFVRADTFGDLETAIEVTLNKAKMTVDQQGDRIFG